MAWAAVTEQGPVLVWVSSWGLWVLNSLPRALDHGRGQSWSLPPPERKCEGNQGMTEIFLTNPL